MRIKGLCCLLLIVVFYTVLMVTYFQNKQLNKKKINSLPPKLIVLVSQPRSGSTFLGNMISKTMESVYFYEPLYRLDQHFKIDINFADDYKRAKYDSMASKYLEKVFTCDFSDRDYWHKIFDSPFKVLSSNTCSEDKDRLTKNKDSKSYTLKRCIPYFNANQVQQECRKSNLMVKLLEMRIPFSNVENLNNLIQTSHKILYLVRDPRAIFLSLLKTGWIAENISDPIFQRYVPKQCKTMTKNINAVAGQKGSHIVRFEDIIVKPHIALKPLFEFLDETTTDNMKKALRKQPCYVPKFNNMYNMSLYVNRKLQYKLLPVRDEQDKDEDEKEEEKERWEEGLNDDWIKFRDIRERQRRNYECYAINKWRYVAEPQFIKLVEENCGEVMRLLGYVETKRNMIKVRNIKERLVKSEFKL